MSIQKWLRRADAGNQRLADALLNRVDPDGSGVVVDSELPSNGLPGYPSRVGVDASAPRRLLVGRTFHPMSPGRHVLHFDNGPPWLRFPFGARTSLLVEVPASPRIAHVRYRTTALGRRASTVELVEDDDAGRCPAT